MKVNYQQYQSVLC